MQYALVSGGSKGIGYAIAIALARRKFNLVLVARDKTDLETAKNNLESEYLIHVEILSLDLSQPGCADIIGRWCQEKNVQLKMLCNVTGIGGAKDFLRLPLDDTIHMLRLNTEPAVALVFNLLPLLRANSPSYILNVSSMAGFAPISIKNIYSAAKSAVIFFSYSLHLQLKKDDISVSCLCPGPVFTKRGIQQETIQKLGWFGKRMAVSAEKAGEIAVRKTLRGKMLIIPGILASIVSFWLRILPARFIAFLVYRFDSGK